MDTSKKQQQNSSQEEWKQVTYNGEVLEDYKVHPSGRVKSYQRHKEGKELKGSKKPYGQTQFTLDGHADIYLDKLIAENFVPNPDGHKHVRHKDGDLKNCDADNLEWKDEPDRSRMHSAPYTIEGKRKW